MSCRSRAPGKYASVPPAAMAFCPIISLPSSKLNRTSAQTVDARCSKYAGRRHVRRRWETLGIKAPRRRFFRVQFNISFWFNFVREASVLAVLLSRSRWVTEKTSELQIRGGTILIPKNWNSGSMGYFGVIGTGIGIKGIVIGIKKESFSDSQFLISLTAWEIAIHNS